MKRRTFRNLCVKAQPELHHNVYVVLLGPAAGKLRKVPAENPKRDPMKPCIYVGMTGLTPEERFGQFVRRIQAKEMTEVASLHF